MIFQGIISSAKLQWQDDYSDNGGTIKEANWRDAINYCENLSLGGHSDWRLPNINELRSIVDDTKYNPAIGTVFQHTTSDRNWWSSTTDVDYSIAAYVVGFSHGYGSRLNKLDNYYVRCVCGGE